MTPKVLKIAIVGPLPPPSGGMANQTSQLARLLQEEDIEVVVLRTNAGYRPRWIENIRGTRALFRLVPYLARLWQASRRVDLFHVMANSGWSWHLCAAPAVWIASLRGRPVIINYRGGEAECFFGRSLRWIKPTLDRADRIVVPSGYLEKVFGNYGYSTTVVPNVVDVERFARPQRGAVSNSFARPYPHILVARRLEPIYDIATALRAFRLVKNEFNQASLSIAGSGPQRKYLESLTQELGLTDAVKFLGDIENPDMPSLYHSADIVLNPSLADNMPISILEALASGTPVVSTDVGGVPYLVRDNDTALLVPPGDEQAAANAVLRALNEQISMNLTASGYALVKQFHWAHVRDRLFRVYEELANLRSVAISPRYKDG